MAEICRHPRIQMLRRRGQVDLRRSQLFPRLHFGLFLRGRLLAIWRAQGWQLAAKRLELRTHSGMQLAPMDFLLDWQAKDGAQEGQFTADRLSLDKLAHLSDYLPLDPQTRNLLQAYAPQGEISQIRSHWRWENDGL